MLALLLPVLLLLLLLLILLLLMLLLLVVLVLVLRVLLQLLACYTDRPVAPRHVYSEPSVTHARRQHSEPTMGRYARS